MASTGSSSAPGGGEGDRRDAPWIRLTKGMEPYERFRYIVRHVLEAAVEDAHRYADDERLFEVEADDLEASREHLRDLEARVQEDAELTELERAFLCEALAAALRARGLEARCYRALFGRGWGDGNGV